MLGFKQFLIEKPLLSNDRAKQVIDRLSKTKRFVKDKNWPDNISFGRVHPMSRYIFNNVKGMPRKPENGPYEEKDKPRLVPHDKIYSIQNQVSANTTKNKIDNIDKNSSDLPTLIYHEPTDTYHITDGNNRIAASKIKRETHILAYVTHSNDYYHRRS